MKRLLILFSCISLTCAAFANGVKIGDIYYLLGGDTAIVTYTGADASSRNTYSGSISIPTSVTYQSKTYSVTTIGDEAFYNCGGLTSVTIGNSVTSIGERAFWGCKGLTSITIPNSVTTIGTAAFVGCDKLTSVTIGNSVTSIGVSAFEGCLGLTSVTIPNSVTTIGGSAFRYCYGLTSVTIGNSVTSIGVSAFESCHGLTSVTIGNSVTSIGERAFYNVNNIVYNGTATGSPWGAKCVNGYVEGCFVYSDATKTTLCGCSSAAIGKITIPNSVTTIGDDAFYYCSDLTSITIPNSVITIGTEAFQWCTGLTSITIPNSVTTIGGSAFRYCYGLTSVTIGNSVTTIGDYAFDGCRGLTSIDVDADNTHYCSIDGVLFNYVKNTLIQYPRGNTRTKYTIPNSVTMIGDYAFDGCRDLRSVTIPNSVTTIGDRAFNGCSGLWSVTSYAATPPTCSSYGCFDGVSESIPIYVPVRSIDAYKQASGWKKFTNIQGNPNDYATVTCYAENGSVNGTGKYIKGDTCTLTATANYGYHFTQWEDGNTDNPRTIQIVSDITFIACFAENYYSFKVKANDDNRGSVTGTNGIYKYQTKLTVSATARMDLGYHFAKWSDGNTDNPRTLTLTENTVLVAQFEENKCGEDLLWKLDTISGDLIITGTGDMDDEGFRLWNTWVSQITSVFLSQGITHIGNNAFANCSKLTSINIPNSVTTIGESAFENCTYLKTITLGKSLTDIGCKAFKGDFRVEEITSYAEVTPNVCSSTFDGLSKRYIYLYVPENSIRGYQVDPNWNGFDIRTKSADKKPIDGDNPIVTPSNQDVTITWPITDGTNTYTLTITKNGEVVCVLTFNANGQLTNIAFAAPSHNGAHQVPAATLTAQGYQFTVTGLNPGTAYDYSVTATDAGGQTLAEHKGNFSTTGGTGLNTLPYEGKEGIGSKYLHNGNLIIERNGIKYTATGQKVR